MEQRGVGMTTDAVILAGGFSSRANAFKMELKLEGKAVLQHVIDAFLPVCRNIIIVGGYQIERLFPLTSMYGDGVKIVFNEEYEKGMFTSVKRGIKEVTASQFFLTPGDYPLLTTEVCRQLLEYSGQIVKPRYQSRGGHPILLPYFCVNEILAEGEASNLKLYLDKKEIKIIEINDESILMDLDTREDFEKIKDWLKGSQRFKTI
jgi:molybdenum cofactor cytidylyltransferase